MKLKDIETIAAIIIALAMMGLVLKMATL